MSRAVGQLTSSKLVPARSNPSKPSETERSEGVGDGPRVESRRRRGDGVTDLFCLLTGETDDEREAKGVADLARNGVLAFRFRLLEGGVGGGPICLVSLDPWHHVHSQS
jgi:hypothetical protein